MVMPLWLVSKNEIASGNNCNTWSVLERMHFHDKTEFRVKKKKKTISIRNLN